MAPRTKSEKPKTPTRTTTRGRPVRGARSVSGTEKAGAAKTKAKGKKSSQGPRSNAEVAKKPRTSRRVAAKSRPDMPTPDENSARADFVRYFVEQDFAGATRAYMRAYPNSTEAAAATSACALLKEPKIQEAMSTELAAVLKEKRRPLEKRILDTYLVRAFYDPTEILDLHGNLRITEKELRRCGLQVCIDSINKKLNARGDPYLEYKLADRDRALDMLRQYIQMIEPPRQKVLVENITIGAPPQPDSPTFGLPKPQEAEADLEALAPFPAPDAAEEDA